MYTSKSLLIMEILMSSKNCCRLNPGQSANQPSGYGFELTFRLVSEEQFPPTWPAELLQALARYVFSSDNALCVGDHISWHSALDSADSSLQHMILAQDPQLQPLDGPLGHVNFVQVCSLIDEGEREDRRERERGGGKEGGRVGRRKGGRE